MLQVREVHTYYDKSHILHGVSFYLNKGELVCLLGRNGVGKSTTLKSIMGLVQPRQGSISFKGNELIGRKAFEIARIGVGYVPEERRIFRDLTVHENLLMGIKSARRTSPAWNDWSIEKVYELFPLLRNRRNNIGGKLSGGEQQILTVARTMLGNPEAVLIDEPTEGLAPLIVKDVLSMLDTVRKSGVTILLVEQNFKAAIKLGDRFYVMGKGKIVFEGDKGSLLTAKGIRENYLEV